MPIEQNIPSAPSVEYSGVNYLTSSQIIKGYALAQKEVDEELYGRYNDTDLGVMRLMEELGQKKATTSVDYEHYEEDFNREIIRVNAGYTVAAAVTTFTVSSSSPDFVFEYPPSGETFYPAAVTAYGTSVREGDVLEAKVGAARYFMRVGTVTNASTTTFVAELFDVTGGAATFAAGLAGVEIFKTGRIGAETGNTPKGLETRLIKYQNNIQIIDEGYEFTSTSMAQESFFGGDKKFNYVRSILNTRKRFDATCDLNLLTGRKITSSSSAFNEMLSSEGLIPFLQNYSNEVTYTTLTLDKFNEMSLNLRKFSAPDKVMLLCSASFETDIEDLLRESGGLTAGGVIYDASKGGKHEVDFGFKRFTKGSIEYNVKSIKALTDPKSLGSADSPYANYGMVLPTGTVESFDYGKNPVTVPAIRLRYQDVPYHEEGYREWLTGGSGTPNPTDTSRTNKVNMVKHVGFEAFKPNTMGIFTK